MTRASALRYQKEILDFYLSHFVFPGEAKEFPRKLSSSAWDMMPEYDCKPTGSSWTHGATQFWNSVDGSFCLAKRIPLLRYQKEILDFYLSHFVFPGEAKEFPRKLSSSANGQFLDARRDPVLELR
jgi:hypothetical protein